MSKKNCVKKLFIFTVIMVLVSMFFCGCGDNTDSSTIEVPEEYLLLSAHVETRNVTNRIGGVIDTDTYFCYAFATDSGEVLFKEQRMLPTYDYVVYSLEFQIGDENKILQYSRPKTKLVFIMTEELYSQVFTGQ